MESSGSGLRGEGLRFALSGSTVAVVYLATTTLLADVVGLPFEAALPIGTVIAVCVHFSLQRLFVWTHRTEFALTVRRQVASYLVVIGIQYGITSLSTWLLPPYLGLPVVVVYLATVAVLTSTNFLIFRHLVFHERAPHAVIDAPARDAVA